MGTRGNHKAEVLGMRDDVGHAIPNKPKPPSWKSRTTKFLVKAVSLSSIVTTLIVINGITCNIPENHYVLLVVDNELPT